MSRTAGPLYLRIASELREQITGGSYEPGARLPTERELMQRYGVSSRTIRVALDQLRAEGLVISKQGTGVFVRRPTVPRRLSTDISTSFGWYTSLAHQGFQPAGQTTVTQGPCPAVAAEWLGIDPGTVVTVRDRIMGTEGEPPAMLATSYFPSWVTDAAPKLADPNVGGMPEHIRKAFGQTYSHDVLTARMPNQQEADRLDLPPGTPVQVIHGATYDQDNRPLHYIHVVAAGGRIEFAYVYGAVPTEPAEE
jgi:GntR family transcriptional regulator